MRERRFFVKNEDIKGNTALLSSRESHHLKDVLNLKKGDSIIVFNGEGQEFEGKIASLSGRVGVLIERKRRIRPLDMISVCLAQSLPKKKKMDFIIAKACELGVAEVFPLETERASFKLAGPVAQHVLERWEKIAVQTCKQSHLDWIPRLHKPIKLKDLLQKAKEFRAVLIPHTDTNLPKLSDTINTIKNRIKNESQVQRVQSEAKTRKVLIVIGPEGGFSEKEVALAKERGAYLVQLGDLVLKTETAAVVGIALVKYAFNL